MACRLFIEGGLALVARDDSGGDEALPDDVLGNPGGVHQVFREIAVVSQFVEQNLVGGEVAYGKTAKRQMQSSL